jgi:hypothetical protein
MAFQFMPRYVTFGLMGIIILDNVELSSVLHSVFIVTDFSCCMNLKDKLERHVGIFE